MVGGGEMRFFNKTGQRERKIILIILFLSFIFIVFSIKLNLLPALTSYKKNSIDGAVIENDSNKLFSEQESNDIEKMENRNKDLDNRYKEIEQMARELEERQKELDSSIESYDFQIYDLLYRYEPYHIY
jgi:predicted ribosome quality control (RQC) complex YloA/Tae2 family protein